ncbi:DNA mismatch repair protein Mlh3-like [Tubulanus polymorphus]|uniref:DNA mismatch repair protein Mlh3-like n=1 Tax=Tubulanus polymorphus TaxID=672921 RepID=UPI003DA537FC
MLMNALVIQQIDRKFIACLLQVDNRQSEHNLLVLIDQHAADERVRLEKFILELKEEVNGTSYIKSTDISPAIQLQLHPSEIRILKANPEHFLRKGVKFSSICEAESTVSVTKVPSCFIQAVDTSTTFINLKLLIQDEIQLIEKTGGANTTIPRCIFMLLSSQACHGAIKFGDEMTQTECENLIQLLSNCDLPFQCAHGRPSIVPIIDLMDLTRKLQPFQVKMPPKLWKLREKL